MAIEYKVYQRKNRLKNNETIQVAMQVNKGQVPLREIANRLERVTSLGRGDVLSVLTHLGEVVAEYMKMGYSVKLHELGTFTPRISSHSIPVGKEFKSDYIKGVKMRFTPSIYIKDELSHARFKCQENDTCKAPHSSHTEEGSTHEEESGDIGI